MRIKVISVVMCLVWSICIYLLIISKPSNVKEDCECEDTLNVDQTWVKQEMEARNVKYIDEVL